MSHAHVKCQKSNVKVKSQNTKDKRQSIKDSYCFFDTGVYLKLGSNYLPGEQNSNEDGSARDMLGKEVKYRCVEEGCLLKRQVENLL